MEAKQKNRLILIADDDDDDQEMLGDAISEVDPEVTTARVSNGKETIGYLEHCSPERLPCAIILDYSMPILNGYEVLTAICKDKRFAAIPKFIWSTSNSSVHIKECMDTGALNYFVKPDHPAALKIIVAEILAACR